MKTFKTYGMLAGVVGVLLLPMAASANLVIDGGFEVPIVIPSNPGYTTINVGGSIGQWMVASGSVDLIGSYWVGDPGKSVDMAGLWQNGTIKQAITTVPGQLYQLTFDMSGNPDNNHQPQPKAVLVQFGSSSQTFTFSSTTNTRQNMGWQLRTADFTATSSSTLLMFTDVTGGLGSGTAFGAAIDNVSLLAVPEPTTFVTAALLSLPFLGATIRRMRR